MHYHLAFIGGGTASLAGITEAVELGLGPIAYIENRKEIGSICALDGCAPMHRMLAVANILKAGQKAPECGFVDFRLKLDFQKMMEGIEAAIHQDLGDPFANDPNITLYLGHASFLDPYTLKIQQNNGEEAIITADQFVIATGAQPVVPDIPGLKETGYWVYSNVTHARRLPESLGIVGGGRIGAEFAQLLNRLGSRVTLLESHDRILHREDQDASEAIRELLEREGVEISTRRQVLRVEVAPNGKKRIITAALDGKDTRIFEVDEILVAAGRRGCPKDLNLEAAGVRVDQNGILINNYCQTSAEHIWAIGDVAGPYRFTHAANHQAVIAVHNLSCSKKQCVDYRVMPLAYYFEPPMARVGLTETEAREKFPACVVLTNQADSASIARIEKETEGFCKIIVDTNTDEIVGAHLFCTGADDVIHIIALAMLAHVPVTSMTHLTYAYPTKAQLVQKTLEKYREKLQQLEKSF